MNQITVASVMMHLNMTKAKEPDENMVRHMILNSLRMYRTRFLSEFGEWCCVMIPNIIGGVITFQNINIVEERVEEQMIRIGISFLIVLTQSKKR